MLKMKSLAGALYLLLLLTFIHSCSGNSVPETVVVFKDGQTNVVDTTNSARKTTQKTMTFNAPSFVSGMIDSKEFLAIIASGRVKESSNDYTDVVVKTRYGNKEWTDAEIFNTQTEAEGSHAPWGDTTAVINGENIYVLITSIKKEGSSKTLRDPLMIVGTVTKQTANNIDSVSIAWGTATPLKDTVLKIVDGTKESQFIGGEGNGIISKNGTIIFPIVIVKDGNKIASTLYSTDNGQNWLIGGETESKTSDGSVVELSKEKLLFVAGSEDGFRKVFESKDLGITWNPSPIFFGVWGNSKSRQGKETPGSVIAVSVENKNVLLFAYPQNKGDKNNLNTLQLWLSDGQRIMCVGSISDETNEDNTGHSVLAYVGGNIYITHQINPPGLSNEVTPHKNEDWKNVIGLTPLTELFEKVKATVLAWRNLDEGYKSKSIPTDALVGFLGNTKADDDKVWPDMYNCVNATVTNGKSVDGGFQFNGALGSGAKWPVVSQGQNQVYKFTEKQFTLAATIKIHSKRESGDVFLLGASANDDGSDVLIGLGYTKEVKWYLKHKNNEKIDTDVPVELDEEYHVAITLDKKAVSVYVGGKKFEKQTITIEDAVAINHFFIGGTEVSSAAENDNLCTVKNVMLFSRALDESEIEKLTKVKDIHKMNEQPKENERHVRETPVDNSRVEPSRDTGDHELTRETNHINTRGNENTISGTGSTSTTENIQSISTQEPKEGSDLSSKKATNEKYQNKKINNALHGKGNAVLKKNSKSDNGAALSLSAVAWMCSVCSLIALIGF